MTALDFPNSPTVGQTYAPGGGALTYLWDGTRWRLSGSSTPSPSGMMGYSYITGNIAGYGTTMIDVYGLTITFNAVAGRTYKVSGEIFAQCNTAGTIAQMSLVNGAGATLNLSNWALQLAANSYKGHIEHVFTASVSASTTVKLMFCVTAGTGTVVAGPAFPGFLLVEDITYQAGGGAPTAVGPSIIGKLINMGTSTYRDLSPSVAMEIETGSAVCQIANTSGWSSFAFQRVFTNPPMVLCINGDNASGLFYFNTRTVSTSVYGFVCIRYDQTYPPNGSYVRCNYIAISPSA